MSKLPHLSRKLVLEENSRISDGAGGFTDNWVALGTLFAQITARTGRARETSLNDRSEVRMKITVRSAPVGTTMRPRAGQRFVEQSRIYEIDAVSETDPAGLYLTCWATEEAAV